MDLHKILKIVAMTLAVFGAIFALMIITGSESMIDNMLYIAYAVLAVILVLVLIYVLKGLVTGNAKKTLLSLGMFVGVLVIAYLMSSGSDLNLQPFLDKGLDVTESTSKTVGAGLNAFYILAVVAIGSVAFSGLKKAIKK